MRRSSTLARGIPVTQTAASPYSIDENLFGRSIEAGILEDPWNAPPEEPYAFTSDPAKAPPPTEIVVGFEQGIPVALDGEELSLAELIGQLNQLAGAYGIGRIDMVENRAVGIKSREVYEAPAALTLVAAHSALEDVVLTKDEARLKRPLEQRWTEIVYEGRWFSPAREAIDAFVDSTQELVTGEVRVELRPNAAIVTGRRSPYMLYAADLASYGTGETFPHEAAEGFIRISALETELHAAREVRDRDAGIIHGWRPGPAGSRALSTLTSGGSCASTTPSSSRTTARRPRSTPGRLAAAKVLTQDELEEVESRLAEIAHEPESYLDSDEDVHWRSSACWARSGARSTRVARGTTGSRRPSLYVLDARARRRATRSTPSRSSSSPLRSRRRRPSCPATRTCSEPSRSPSGTTCSPGWRCSIATGRGSRRLPTQPRTARSAQAR
jgi:hypothetical protein